MVVADWGFDEQPGHFGKDGLQWDPVHSDRREDVPEVAEARELGYFPVDEAPIWCFLPAIWPRGERAWVRDQRVRHLTRQCDGGPVERLPWTAAEYADCEADTNDFLDELGLPARPSGRIWLLRPPAGSATLDEFLSEIWSSWQASGGPAMANGQFVAYVETRIHDSFLRPGTDRP